MTPDAAIEARVAEAVPDPLAKIRPRAIAELLGRGPTWFEKSSTRRQLEAVGFPNAVSRGVWLKRDVVRFALRRSAGLPTQPAALAAAGDAQDLDQVMARTRQHLAERRHKRGSNHGRGRQRGAGAHAGAGNGDQGSR